MQSDNNTKTPSDEGAPPPPFKDDKEDEGNKVAQTEMPLGANTHDTMDMSSSSSDDKSDEPLIETTPPDSRSRQPLEIDDKQDSDNSGDSSSNSEQGAAADNDEDPTSTAAPKRNNNNNNNNNGYTKTAISLFLLAFIVFVIVDSATNQWIKSGINAFLEWMEEEPIAGFFAFVALCFLTTMLFIPGILLTVGSGFVFANAFGLGVGMVLGILAAFTGAFCGSVVSFLLGRFLLRDCVGGLTKKFTLLEALDNALEEKGFRIMALLRLSPLIYASPYLNYGMGGTSISFRDFTLAMFAILPGTAMFVFLGASANSLSGGSDDDDDDGVENDDEEQDEDDDSAVTTIILVVGIVVSIIAVAFTSYYAKMELDKVVAANRRQEEDSDDGHEAAALDMVADDSAGPTAAPLLEGNRVVC